MLDNLRDQTSFTEEEPEPLDEMTSKPPKQRKPRRSFNQITGTTAQQRFALAVMLMIVVLLLGVMLMFLSGKMIPSFMY